MRKPTCSRFPHFLDYLIILPTSNLVFLTWKSDIFREPSMTRSFLPFPQICPSNNLKNPSNNLNTHKNGSAPCRACKVIGQWTLSSVVSAK